MARPSTVDRLPAEQRDLIHSLRGDGRTIEEILDELHERGARISRAALGRHIQELDAAEPDSRLGLEILALSRSVARLGAEVSALRRSLRAHRRSCHAPRRMLNCAGWSSSALEAIAELQDRLERLDRAK